ncbi:rodlin [Streptomyces subrutilus]|uniref:RdlA protein n=1 Tax=Streptomyces subrutilus TaxID=36818 RepID=A0A1E5Q2I8_9ACTN|nr:rodlin [Streptomyces subrutilus]OEJ36055.1 RdlA protein [Streptomyces subrutilus]
MIKKIMATAAATASLVGAGAAVAAPAMAIGNDNGVNTVNGNGASQVYGNQKTHGDLSPQLGLVQGTLNKPCIGLPAKVNAQSLVGLINVGVQDINVLSNPMNQQCTENSTQAKGDEPLSHILSNIPVLSGNLSAGS